jgi:hypothetical protein
MSTHDLSGFGKGPFGFAIYVFRNPTRKRGSCRVFLAYASGYDLSHKPQFEKPKGPEFLHGAVGLAVVLGYNSSSLPGQWRR